MADRRVQFVVTGEKEIREAMRRLPMEIERKVLGKALIEGLKPMRNAVRAASPVGSHPPVKDAKGKVRQPGYLRRSWRIKLGRSNGHLVGYLHSGGAYYGAFLEYGTSRQAPRPFFRPAVAGAQGQVVAQMATTMRGELGKYREGRLQAAALNINLTGGP